MDDITINLRHGTRQAINPKALPYVEFRRIVNPGESDQKEVTERVVLCDQFGSPFVWVDQNWVTHCLQRGWEIVGYGNFDRLRRHDGTLHQQLEDIRPLVEGHSDMRGQIEAMRAENEKLKAERATLIAALPTAEGDFRTQDEKDAGIVSVVLDKDAPGAPAGADMTDATTPASNGAKSGKAK
jgi:hypothetical protein